MKRFTVAVMGTGSRGYMFAETMFGLKDRFEVVAICDFDPKQLEKTQKILNLPSECLFTDEESFFTEKRADAIVIATWDKYHVKQCIKAMRLGYDVLLEKPISDDRAELEEMLRVQNETGRKVAVCHELRYGKGYEKLSELLEQRAIGDLIAIDAMERVAFWHQAQAYVRIQSIVNDLAYPTILAKCSHDLDLVQHYAGSECDTVSSVGRLKFFRKENAPEGATERCLDCPNVEACPYSAKKIYIDGWNEKGRPGYAWPFTKVTLKRPITEKDLYKGIENTCYGKCVFLCGVEENPTVVDNQMVQMQFKNGVIATLKMLFAHEPGRRINLFGTYGELLFDERSETIEIRKYGEKTEIIELNTLIEGGHGHGGGDARLVYNFYNVLAETGNNKTSLKESVECHLMGVAAEESRHNGGKVVKVHE